jgi:hypothetical protein
VILNSQLGNVVPDHLLHFTSILAATSGEQYTADSAFGGQVAGRAAEIAYLLDPVPTGSTGGATPVKTFKLVRRQRVACLRDSDKAGFFTVARNADVAVIAMKANPPPAPNNASPGVTNIFTLADLKTNAGARLQKSPINPGPPPTPVIGDEVLSAITGSYNNLPVGSTSVTGDASRVGNDLLLSNVISFEVKVATTPETTNTFPANGDFPYDLVPSGGYDSTSSTTRIKAIQVRIRVYDPALKLARQITIVQDM